MSATIEPYGKLGAALVVVPGTQYTESFSLGSLLTTLGYVLTVTVAGAGTVTITPQTTVSDGSDGDATQWADCSTSAVYSFALGATNTLRGQVTDPVFDKIRLKIVGDATAAGTVQVLFAGDQPIT